MFLHYSTWENYSMTDFIFAPCKDKPGKIGSTLKRENLLSDEQVLSFQC